MNTHAELKKKQNDGIACPFVSLHISAIISETYKMSGDPYGTALTQINDLCKGL